MNRLAKIRHTFTHRRSKSDSQMFNDWSTDCLQPDDEDFEESPAIMAETCVTDDPFSVESNNSQQASPEPSKTGSTGSLPFLANLASGFRKKLTSDGNILFASSPDDSAKLHSSEDHGVFSYDNDGLRKSTFEEERPAEGCEGADRQAVPAEVAWVTFDDDFPPLDPAAEFVEIPLDGGEEGAKEDGASSRLMQNLKKIPMRFMKNQRYKSLQPETGGEEEEAASDNPERFFRSSSLPSSPSMRKKLASAFSNMKRQ